MGTARAARTDKRNEKPINKFKTKKPLIDKKEQNRLVLDNEGFAITVANRYQGIGRKFGLSFEDLKQECNLGFVIASQRWDPNRGVKFVTYAGIWARKCIMDALSNKNPLHLPRGIREQVKSLRDALAVIKENGDPSKLGKVARREYDEIMKGDESEENALRKIEILERRIIRATRTNISLDQPMGEDGKLPYEFLVGFEETISDEVEKGNMREVLLKAMEKLSNRERIVIENRFLRVNPLTLEEIGNSMGISSESVRQKRDTALRKLAFELKTIKAEEKLLECSISHEPEEEKGPIPIAEKPANNEPREVSSLAEDVMVKKELRLLNGFKTEEKKKKVYLERQMVPENVIKNLDLSQIELEKLIRFVGVAKKHNAFECLRTNHILNNTTSAGFEGFIKWKMGQTAQRTI